MPRHASKQPLPPATAAEIIVSDTRFARQVAAHNTFGRETGVLAMTGSDLYRRAMAYYEAERHNPELQHKVWDETPWIVDAYSGSCDSDRMREMMEWCRDQFGDEAWPIHERPGNWNRGSATIYGWTWFGFATEAMMNAFIQAWPAPEEGAA